MIVTDTHVYFYTNVFSNWYSTQDIKSQFTDNITGLTWNNTEEAFMFYKAFFFCDTETMDKICFHSNNKYHPLGVKDLGRLVKKYDDKAWGCVRFGYMVYVNYLKFSQNADFKKLLLDTGDRILVEASPVDKIWGVGLEEKDDLILNEKNWKGQNLLGKALMEVRSKIK